MHPEKRGTRINGEISGEKYEKLTALKKELDLEVDQTRKIFKKATGLKANIEKRLNAPEEHQEEHLPSDVKAVWENPKTNEKKEIILNIDKEIEYFKKFYADKLNIKIDEKKFRTIWDKNRKEIQKEMETYGYDALLLIQEDLPDFKKLKQKLIQTTITDGRGLWEIKNAEKPKTSLVLTKNVRNNEDPIIGATSDKDIMELTGLTREEVEKRIQNRKSLPINFETTINNPKIRIQSQGLSLEKYQLFREKYFDQNKKYPNEWTWLLESRAGDCIINCYYNPVDSKLHIGGSRPGLAGAGLVVHLSRSFYL